MTDPTPAFSSELVPPAVRSALRERIQGDLSLPLFDASTARVLAACQDDDCDLVNLAELVTHDQALTTHVLRAMNSAAYAAREPILSLPQAVRRLGFLSLRQITIAIAVRERVFSVPGDRTCVQNLWQHAVVSACYAGEIANHLRSDADVPFLCGLLHDVGMPVALQLVRDLEQEGVTAPLAPEVVEALMDEFHCELGAKLAQNWRLGPWIDTAARYHHHPELAPTLKREAELTGLADLLAHWAVDRPEQELSPDEPQARARFLREGDLAILQRRRERVLNGAEAYL